jgi:hypothetical protein
VAPGPLRGPEGRPAGPARASGAEAGGSRLDRFKPQTP